MNRVLLILHLTALIVCAAAPRPNIVFIMADDLGYGDLGCYGQKLIATPNIDRLAREGLRFTQAYAGGPVCAAARSVLMTGLHNGHTPARDNVPHYETYLNDEDVTVAEVLKSAGYGCAGVGKWSLGDAGTIGRATNQGFDHWFGYLNQDHAHYYYTEYLDDDEGRLELTGNSTSRKSYSHDLMTGRALKFIRGESARATRRPFFLYAAYTLPHFSSKAEDKDGLAVPSTAPYSDRNWDEKSKKYAAMIHMLDRDVGRIVKLVDDLGLSRDTLIIFTSDNGGHAAVAKRFHTSGPLRGYKRGLTEGGIRVPFIARWPGKIPVGKTNHEIIAFQDMLPTFAELAGVGVKNQGNIRVVGKFEHNDRLLSWPVDGISILPALKGGELTTPREFLYWDYGHCRGKNYAQAVRMGRWKGILRARTARMELYDLDRDIGESNNLAARHPEIVRQIDAIMKHAVVPDPRYEIGTVYQGGPIWKKAK